jgi:hypothetical protein
LGARLGDLALIDEICWQASNRMDYIEQLRKAQHDDRLKEKIFEEGDLVLWIKIKGGKF